MTKTFYITTAIPYVNARPHLGFALETIQADAFARYHRLKGDDVRFLTGSDENSLSNVRAAEEEGITPKELVERNARYFEALKDQLGISFDDFIRTSSETRHLEGAKKLWEACERSGDIYKKPYKGLYCIGCEQFYTEDELEDGVCPRHRTEPEEVEEENYFFRLTNYSDELLSLIDSDELRIVPQSRKNEITSLIKMGLNDFSISRSRERAHGWGVPVPGDDAQVMYVWFDALSNYINAIGYANEGPQFERYWTAADERVHCIGKDIIRFHTVYWPAMLLSAKVPLPTTVFVHGFITVQGTKMSKTLGNVVDPVETAATYGIDQLRYYLLRKIPATDDGNFTIENLIAANNSDLADQLGNLLSRVVGMVTRYCEGVVPEPAQTSDGTDASLKRVASQLPERITYAMENAYAPGEALNAIWDLIAEANRYVVEVQPWVLAKQRADADVEARLSTALYNLTEVLRMVAWACAPFMPSAADSIAAQIGVQAASAADPEEIFRWGQYPPGTKLAGGEPLFPKYDLADTEAALAQPTTGV